MIAGYFTTLADPGQKNVLTGNRTWICHASQNIKTDNSSLVPLYTTRPYLPIEIIHHIFSFLPPDILYHLSSSLPEWADAVKITRYKGPIAIVTRRPYNNFVYINALNNKSIRDQYDAIKQEGYKWVPQVKKIKKQIQAVTKKKSDFIPWALQVIEHIFKKNIFYTNRLDNLQLGLKYIQDAQLDQWIEEKESD